MNHKVSPHHCPVLPARQAATRLPPLIGMLLLMLTLPYLVFGVDGTLDFTFDGDGIVTTDITNADTGRSVAVQGDGKILVAGEAASGELAVVRYNSDGTLDSGFDNDGIVTATRNIIGGYITVKDMAVQGDGKILVAGDSLPGNGYDIALIRYNRDGTLDNSFDGDGIVTTTITTGLSQDTAYAVTVQGDNKILVTGATIGDGYSGMVLVRYNSAGSLDTTLDSDGIVVSPASSGLDVGYDLAVQGDGKILVVGEADDKFTLMRYNSDGSPDSTFDGDGIATRAINPYVNLAGSVGMQGDGKILVLGWAANSLDTPAGGYLVLVRYNSDGSLDSTFGSDGIVTSLASRFGGYGLTVQENGKILVARDVYGFGVARYNSDGSLDSTFDGDGIATADVGTSAESYDMAVQRDGKILLVGKVDGSGPGDQDIVLVRYENSTVHRLYLPFTR